MNNRPEKDSEIKVEPIRKRRDIKAIKQLLSGNPRNEALFVIGINTDLRPGELLSLTVGQVKGLKPGESVEIQDEKSGKSRQVPLNKPCIAAIEELLKFQDFKEDKEHIFLSQRKGALTLPSLSRLVKDWCSAINLEGNYASHSLRKTWGYHQRVTYNVALSELTACFNHGTQRQTLEYLCIQPEEIKSIYENEL